MYKRKVRLSKPRLITAGTADASYYWIDPPSDLTDKEEFEFKLYLEDDFGKKWISENGGRAQEGELEKDGKKEKGLIIIIWSHKTFRSKWKP